MLVLSREDVERLLDVDLLFERLERAFVELSAGRASVPPRVAAFAPAGLLATMPGYVDGVLAAKLVAVFPDHEPSHQALIAVFDPETGTPLAVMDGTHVTAVRTGASSAVATRALAREDSRVLAVLGAACRAARTWTRSGGCGASRRCGSPAAASSTRPRWRRRWVRWRSGRSRRRCAARTSSAAARTRRCRCFRASGSRPGRTSRRSARRSIGPELDRETVEAGLLCVESRVAFEPPPAGSFELQGLEPNDAVEVGEVLAGTRPGRTSDDQITVYKSMGHAVEDAAAAALVLEQAGGSGPADLDAELLGRPQLAAAGLALDGERGGEARAAARALRARSSPPHCGQASGSSARYSSK